MTITDADAAGLVRLARSVLADQAAALLTGDVARGHGEALANVTVHVRRLRACMSGRGATLGDAVRRAAVRAAADTRYGPRLSPADLRDARLELWIQTSSHVVGADHVTKDVDLGRDGVEISCEGRFAYYTPAVALTHNMSRHEHLLDRLAKKAGLATGAWRDPGATLRRTTWEHYSEVPGDPGRVQRLRRLRPAELGAGTPAALRAHADLAADRLMRVQQGDGYYLYKFHPFTNRQTPGPGNLVRQAGCAYAMARAADSAAEPGRRDDLAASASRVVDALLSRAVLAAGSLFIADLPATGAPVRGKLGTLALTLAAVQCPSLSGRYQSERRRLVEAIMSWQRPDGSFRCATDSTGVSDDGSSQDYFPGEALMALAAELRAGGGPAQRAMAAALPWYAARFRAQPTTAFVPWQIEAWARYADWAREASLAPDAAIASDFVFQMADWILRHQFRPGACDPDLTGGYARRDGTPGASTATYTQAVISAYKLARQFADHGRADCYRTASLLGLDFIRGLQLTPAAAYLYPDRARTIGGTSASLASMTIRCDHDQHALTAYLAALETAGLLGP